MQIQTTSPARCPTTSHAIATSTSVCQPMRAALNQLGLLSPQRVVQSARLPRPYLTPINADIRATSRIPAFERPARANQPVIDERRTVELILGTDPQCLIERASAKVGNPALRRFLAGVMAERDVNRVLTVLIDEGRQRQRLPIERLRAAGETARNQSMLGAAARDTLYAAVLMAGIQSLLGQTVRPPYLPKDVMRSAARAALHRLEAEDATQACHLRNYLGWGLDEDMDEHPVQAARYLVRSAMLNLCRYSAFATRVGRA